MRSQSLPRPRVGAFRWSVVVATAVLAVVPVERALSQADTMIQEIIVTARKKAESLQEVPVAITAFSADSIQDAGIRDLYDVAELTPGLSFFNAQGEFLAVPVIRGMAPTDIFGENNAAIFVDGIYVSGREGLNFSQLDLERIEVVKGPQSALYGRNAFSGAINYVTRMPSSEFGMKADMTGGSDGRLGGQAAVTGPLFSDQLTGRLSVLYDEFSGTYGNPLGHQDIGGYRYRSYQGTLRWKPADNFTMTGALYYSNDEVDDSATTAYKATCENRVDANLNIPRLQDFCGRIPSLDEYAGILRGIATPSARYLADAFANESIPKIARALGEDRDLTRGHLTIDWGVLGGTVTALTGYSRTTQAALVDGNRSLGTDLPFVFCTSTTDLGGGAYSCNRLAGVLQVDRLTTGLLQIQQESETREISQEIRFTSSQDQPLRWSAGAYWYDVDRDVRERGVEATHQPAPAFPGNQFGPIVTTFPVIIGDAAFRPWFQPGGDADPLKRHIQENRDRSWSVFTAADLSVTEALTLDAQLRYGHENKEVRGYKWDEVNLAAAAPLLSARDKDSWDAVTWRVGAKLDIATNWMTYASLSRGEKAGGFDVVNVNYVSGGSAILIKPFDSEHLLATELGIKGRTPDGRLAVDLSVYYNDWTDVVIPEVYEASPFDGRVFQTPVSFNGNLGNATIIGWEVVTELRLTDDLSMRLSGSHTDATWNGGTHQATLATFPSFRPADCQGAVVDAAAEAACKARSGDISGNTMLRQPEWQASASLEYRRALPNGWNLFSRADLSYQGKVYEGNSNLSWLPDHSYVNLKLGIESGRYSVEVWGRNIFNDDGPVAVYRDVFFTNATDVYQQAPPVSTPDDFFPWRLTVTHPRLATWGITARVRFGSEAR
ncbi:MAG: TonB-dependent receptor [Gammaproteobacteria bacterium]|nr:TonB-dependent receptor [Gammaproteobacteria bacterium]